jgi:hypothetical protein
MLLIGLIVGVAGSCYLLLKRGSFAKYSRFLEAVLGILGFACYGIAGAMGLAAGHLLWGICFLIISVAYFAGFLRWSDAR